MRVFAKFMALVLSVLGFASSVSCRGLVMYGTPTAPFQLNATVVDKATAAPISDVRVIVKENDNQSIVADTLLTNDKGTINYLVDVNFAADFTIKLALSDIDGPENGAYADKQVEVKVAKNDFKGGDGSWNGGSASKIVVVELDKID